MSDDAEGFREPAQHCRELAGVTRDQFVEQELLRLADEFEMKGSEGAKLKASSKED